VFETPMIKMPKKYSMERYATLREAQMIIRQLNRNAEAYPELAKQYKKDIANVERAINRASL